MSRIVLGVSGGVAAYKAALLLRALTEAGHEVRVVPTESALHFVGAATFEALSGNPVTTDVWSRAASGRSYDLLTATLLTAHCPVLFIPAMHTEMWLHPATRDNV